MRTPTDPRTLPHPFPQPRRSRLLFSALLLGGMSILAACQMTAHELAAMKYRFPAASDSDLEERWAGMSDLQRRYALETYEASTSAKPRKAARDSSDREGGGDGGGGH